MFGRLLGTKASAAVPATVKASTGATSKAVDAVRSQAIKTPPGPVQPALFAAAAVPAAQKAAASVAPEKAITRAQSAPAELSAVQTKATMKERWNRMAGWRKALVVGGVATAGVGVTAGIVAAVNSKKNDTEQESEPVEPTEFVRNSNGILIGTDKPEKNSVAPPIGETKTEEDAAQNTSDEPTLEGTTMQDIEEKQSPQKLQKPIDAEVTNDVSDSSSAINPESQETSDSPIKPQKLQGPNKSELNEDESALAPAVGQQLPSTNSQEDLLPPPIN